MIEIVEKSPSGRNTFRSVSAWLNDTTKKVSDATELWKDLKPEIKQAMAFTFSNANPAGWIALKPSYVKWKTKFGFPGTIGVMTGTLKEAVTNQAEIKESSKYLNWGIKSLTNEFGENTKVYGAKFNEKRPIFKYAKQFINRILKKVFKEFVRKGKEK